MSYDDEKVALIAAFNAVAPSDKERLSLLRSVSAMEKDDNSQQAILRSIAGAIYDGLAYGNWPSI